MIHNIKSSGRFQNCYAGQDFKMCRLLKLHLSRALFFYRASLSATKNREIGRRHCNQHFNQPSVSVILIVN